MDRQDYDTKDGIAARLDTLERLHELVCARQQVGPESDPRLSQFVVMGRFYTDRGGCWIRLNSELITEDIRQQMPPVMTEDEWHEFLKQRGISGQVYEGYGGFALNRPPSHRLVCASCGRGWDIGNCHDYVEDERFEEGVPLDSYVGKTLRQVQEELDRLNDAVRFVDLAVRNDQWVNSSPRARSGENEGWRCADSTDHKITEDYVVQPGDEGMFRTHEYYHGACARIRQAELAVEQEAETVEAFREMFEQTGFDAVVITKTALPNHIRDWVRQEGKDIDDEVIANEMTYFRVETGQGAFGIFIAAYPLIDLTGTNVGLVDVAPELAGVPIPPNVPPLCGFDGDTAFLLRLWQMLVKKGNQPVKP